MDSTNYCEIRYSKHIKDLEAFIWYDQRIEKRNSLAPVNTHVDYGEQNLVLAYIYI